MSAGYVRKLSSAHSPRVEARVCADERALLQSTPAKGARSNPLGLDSKDGPEFPLVAILELLEVEWDRPRQIPHVITITLNVPLQLGQGDVVWVTREDPQMLKGSWEHLRQSLFVIFGDGGDSDEVQIHAIISVKL
jgi:hypothetical protein